MRIPALPALPPTSDTWADKLYSCTDALPEGALVLAAKEAADPTAARVDFDSMQRDTPYARPIEGMANLGLPAFEASTGSVAFIKDSFVLKNFHQHPIRDADHAE